MERKFVVLGDIMLDRYIMGNVNRISPEAPVPIVDVKFQYGVLGGAANTARNISTIVGGENVTLIGSIGNDEAGREVKQLVEKEKINFLSLYNDMTITTVKERIFGSNQQLLRFDIDNKEEVQIPMEMVEDVLTEANVIVVSDYVKGVVTRDIMLKISQFREKIIIDPKPENWGLYPDGVLLMTPNEYEHIKMRYVQPPPRYVLITKGKNGMLLVGSDHSSDSKNIKSNEVINCEVIGAGDTVTAMMAVCLSQGLSMYESAKVANKCACYVVGEPGTAVVPFDVFKNIFNQPLNQFLEV